MRRVAARSARRIVGAALVALLAACGGGSSSPGKDLPDGAPTAWQCSGADLSALSTRVHVSTQGTDDAACGSPTQTCATIPQGIARCAQSGCGVLVRHGLYLTQATIALRDGIGVFGGCRAGDEPDRGYRTTIEASPKIGEPAVDATRIATPTQFHGLVVVAADRAVGEGASIALRATASPGLSLARTVLASGRGGDGAGGSSDAGGSGEPGDDGRVGQTGAAGGRACAAAPAADSRGKGGQGGDGLIGGVDVKNNCYELSETCDCARLNEAASIGRPGAPSASIAGGAGGTRNALPGSVCTRPASPEQFRGDDGGRGNAGACATQGGPTSPDLWGSVAAQAWQPGTGGGGAAGDVGSGGGGGTSGGFCLLWNPVQFVNGVAAGGGGGGGCGGSGGGGGQQGGASIALLVVGATVDLAPQGVALIPGRGGDGGAGGPGNLGGAGGMGGAGGPSGSTQVRNYQCPGASGRGGPGGDGGSGAGGAGGNGGPSIGIALAAGAAQPAGADDAYGGSPGLGGDVGGGVQTSRCTTPGGTAGVGGGAAQVLDFAKPPSNVLSVGQKLTADGVAPSAPDSRSSPNGRYRLTMQSDGDLCLYDTGAPRWCAVKDEQWRPSAYLTMQVDGNLCVYDRDGKNPSCTQTTLGHRGAYLRVEDDGHVVVRDGSLVLWSRPKVPS